MLFFNKKLPENALWLDIFQLDNLVRQKVPFAILDVGDKNDWLEGTPITPTQTTKPKNIVETVQEITPDLQYPLVFTVLWNRHDYSFCKDAEIFKRS